MVKPEIIGEVPVSLAIVKSELERIKTRDGQLNFRAAKCEEYLNDFSLISAEKISQLHTKLQGLNIARLKDDHIVKIIDLLPQTADDVKLALHSATSISRKDMEQIASVVQEFVK